MLRVRGATITLWLAGAVLSGVSCREDDVAGPNETSGPMGSASSSTAATATQALSFRQVSAGFGNGTCGVTTDNRAYCWGSTYLGDGTTNSSLTPVPVSGGLQFRVVSVGGNHTCGVTTDNRAYCWGSNESGQLGVGTTTAKRLAPTPVSGGLQFRQVAAGVLHTCGLATTNRVYCWGINYDGELGDGTTTERRSPVPVAGSRSFRQVSAGFRHSCGVTISYLGFCWGSNRDGRIGDGSTVAKRLKPTAVAGGLLFRQASAGFDHSCAVSTDNRGYCWGNGSSGQIGDGKTYQRWTPRAVAGGLALRRVSAGVFHACGETTDSRAFCWGSNSWSQLGVAIGNYSSKPVAVTGGLLFNQVSAGGFFTCGVASSSVAYCWGDNSYGQLGDGTTTGRYTPLPVASAP